MVFNKRLLTCEDANSVISHFGRGFVDYYELDTRDLSSPDFWFAYDFIDIYRTEDIIQFSINNSLWTLGYYVQSANINDFDVDVTDDRITITGSGLEWCVLVLELSPEFKYDDYTCLEFKPEYLPCIRPFYESIPLVMGFMDNNGDGVVGLEVSDLVTGETLTTDSDGLVAVTSDINKHGEFDYRLETVNGGETVTYNFPFIRVKTELPIRLVNETVYRDKRNQLTFEFLYDDSYSITSSMLFTGNDLVLVVDNVEYPVESFDGNMFSFNVPIGSRNSLTMKLNVGGNDYISMSSVEFNVPVSIVTCSSGSELKSELESDLPASVVLFTGESLDTEITIDSDVLIRFNELVESSIDNVFTVSDGAVLSLADCNFSGKTLVTLDGGECVIEDSTFTHCTRPILTGNGNASITGCQFVDNVTGIRLNGDLNLQNTLFDLSDASYYTFDSVAFVECYGDLTLDYCQYSLDVSDLDSLGFGYLFFLIGKSSMVNNMVASNLLQNEVFPFRKCTSEINVESDDYRITGKNNKAVTYTIEDSNTVYSNHLLVEYIGVDNDV